MSRKPLLLAFLLPICLALATKARAQQTPETARDVQDAEREWQNHQKAIDDDTESIRLHDEEAEECCRTMWSAAFQGNLPQTISAFRDFQAAYLDLKTAYLHRAQCYETAGAWDKTIADCTEVIRLDPRDAAAYSMRGGSHNYNREYDKAFADCNQALALDPKCADAYVNRGDVWMQKGEYDKALADCDKALLLKPRFAKGYLVHGLVRSGKGEYDKALADWEKGLAITPDDWKLLNDLGVGFWKKAQEQDWLAAKAEAAGDLAAAEACRQKSVALKNDAKAKWNRGISVRPTACDIHSNLGFAYSEANDLDSAERHLTAAVRLQPRAPRPRNNLGRILLLRSHQCEAEAHDAEAKGKTDPAEAARVQPLRDKAKTNRDTAIKELEEAVRLDPSLLEARLNLGEVYLSQHDLDKAEAQYRAVVKLQSDRVKDREMISDFSHAHAGLARIAIARNDSDEAIGDLRKAMELNPQDIAAMQLLAAVRFQQGEYREGEKCLARLLDMLPAARRRDAGEKFGRQFETTGKTKEAVRAWTFLGWTFATSPEPRLLDAKAALDLSQRVVALTKRQDPLALDTLAAAQAAGGQYKQAVATAQAAVDLANSQHKKPLAEAIAQRVPFYQQGKPYRSDPNGSDRP